MVASGIRKLTMSKQGIEIEVSEQAIASALVKRHIEAPSQSTDSELSQNTRKKLGDVDPIEAKRRFEERLLASA